MKIKFENTFKKGYMEVLPNISIGWYVDKTFYFGWLFWSVMINN